MTYNTGNPIGSTDPRDLSDNAESFDNAVNDTANPTWTDRLGNVRVTLANQLGYNFKGDYVSGIELTSYTDVIRYSGEFYRPSASATLPYTTTATLPDADSNLVSVGDANLRQELALPGATTGSDLIAHTGTANTVTETLDQNIADISQRTIYVASVAELEALSLAGGVNVYLTQEGRAGEFVVKTGTPLSDPQKGVYVVLANGNYAERLYSGSVRAEWFGAVGDGSIQTAIFNDALQFAAGSTLEVGPGTYGFDDYLRIPSDTTLLLDDHAVMQRVSDDTAYRSMITNDADGVTGGYAANANIKVIGGTWDSNYRTYGTAPSATTLAFAHCENIEFRNLKVFDYVGDGHAIEINGVRDCVIANCTFDTGGGDSSSAEAINVDGMYSSAQFPHFGPYDGTPCFNIDITNNTFRGVASAVGSHSEQLGDYHRYVRVNDNFMSVRREGVSFANWSVSEICNNNIVCSTSSLTDSVDVIGINLKPGVEVQDSIIISGNTLTGFSRGTTGSSSKNIAITGASDYSSGWEDVIISGNKLGACNGTSLSCVYSNSLVIDNNIIKGSAESDTSIGLFGCSGSVVSNNRALENIGVNPGSGAADNSVISGNRFVGNLNVVSGATNTLATGNIFTALTGTGSGSADVHANIIGGTYTA